MLAMFVAHGYDAWVAPAAKLGLGYRITREVAAAALPSFLLLAGVSIALRPSPAAASERAEQRRLLALRGLRLIAAGYALSLAYAWLDGGLSQPAIWLRADVLHAIGASVLLVAAAGGTAVGPWRASVLALAVVLVCPVSTRVFAGTSGALGVALAPFVPIAGVTRFAALPLAGFCFAGLALRALFAGAGFEPAARSRVRAAALALAGVALAILGALGTRALLAVFGGTLSPSHPALLANALDGLGRAVCVLGLAALLPARAGSPLACLGRHSLLLYAVHIPFCYGRFGGALRGRLDLAEASAAVALLALAALLLAWRATARSTAQPSALQRAREHQRVRPAPGAGDLR